MKKRITALVLCALMVLCMLPATAMAETVGDFVVEGGTSGTNFTFSGGVLTFTQPGTYTVSMKTGATIPTTNRIAVNASGTVNITLNGVKISLTSAYSAFDIAPGSTVSLTLAAGTSNELKSGTGKAGIRVPAGASLTISGAGTLKANGGAWGAGIGGGDGENCGTVNISGGTVNATGGDSGAGIGGGQGGNGGAVNISGGTVTAQGGEYAAGIGGGDGGVYGGGDGSTVKITGGSVKAHKGTGSGWQKDIGCGDSLGESAAPGTLKNGAGQNVFLTTVTLKDPAVSGSIGVAKIQSLTTDPALAYGTDGMYTDSDGKLYLYLPVDTLTKAAQTTDGGEPPVLATYMGEVKTKHDHSGAGTLYLPAAVPVIHIGTQPADITVTAGNITQALTVAASVAPSGTPLYQWYQCDDAHKANPTLVSGATGASFAIPRGLASGFTSSTYYYFCHVSAMGAEDVDSNVATVTVQAPETGDFAVTGGIPGTDYTFISSQLKFVRPGAYTVSMKAGATNPTTNRIAVASSGTVNITLSGVRIDLSGTYSNCAFDIAAGSTVNLTLAAGTSNEFTSAKGGMAGIHVPVNASLAINGPGTLKAWGGTGSGSYTGGGAGIGGNRQESAGSVAIAGGVVEVTGGSGIRADTHTEEGGGAGIGGSGNGGAVSISGGTVTARGGHWAAGIGGGYTGNGGAVTITGGSVKALKGDSYADISLGEGDQEDIGRGNDGSSSGTLKNGAGQNVFLTTVTLKATDDAPSSIGVAEIQSLTTSPALAYGTNGMYTDSAGKLYLYLPAGTLTTTAETTDGGEPATYTGEVDTQNDHSGAGALYLSAETSDLVVTGGTPGMDYSFVGGALRFTQPGAYTVSMRAGFPANKSTSDRIVVDAPTGTALNPVHITLGGVRIDTSALVPERSAIEIAPSSYASLTLAAGTSSEFKSGAGKAGIHVPTGASLTIGAEDPGTGTLTARGGNHAAGIGGDGGSGSSDTGGDGGTIVINSGIVKAYAGGSAAGIGGGDWGGSGGSVTVNGGKVEATGAGDGAGIGGGSNYESTGDGGTVRITGGTVTATGGSGNADGTSPGGAGIGGGGFGGDGGAVTISGGIVIATGGGYGAGIGSGGGGGYYPHFLDDSVSGDGGTVTISGGTVTATGGSGASGIGGGNDCSGATVCISGGSVKAKGNKGVGEEVAGIGHGQIFGDDYDHLNSGALLNAPAPGGVPVYLTTVTLDGVGAVTRVTAVTTGLTPAYGANDMYTDGTGKLYLYLPKDTQTTAAAAETGEPPEPTAYTAGGRPITTLNNHSAAGTLYEAIAVTFTSATADGTAGTTTSTRIDLVFSAAIAGLTADNITITDGTGSAVKGALTGSGTAWSIALASVATEGTVSVAVSAPAGYTIADSPQTATVYKAIVPPSITTATLDDGTVGTAYSETLAATGDTPITWSKESGALPGGLTLSSGGVISGTPTAAGTFSFTVKATNAKGNDIEALSITVNTAHSYAIAFNLGGSGVTNPNTVSAYTYGSVAVALSDASRTGYTFGGWYDNAGFLGSAVTAVDDTLAAGYADGSTITLYAKWTANDYTITYHLDGGTASLANPASYTVEDLPLTLSSPTRTGYAFAGWSGTDITGTSMSVTIPAGSTGDRAYTAHWTVVPPGYSQRALTDSATGISVSGVIREDAALTVTDMTLGNDPACDAIRQRMNDDAYTLLLDKDISLSQGFVGTLTITMPVGVQYNGKTVTILHCAGGTLQTYTATVTDGKAVFSVTSLSPFAVFARVSATPPPAPLCTRADVAAVIYGVPEGTPVKAWVGGTEQPTLYTAHDAFGRQAVLWTFYPPQSTGWTVRVEPQLPAGLTSPRWQYRLVWIEPQPAGFVSGQAAGAVTISRCSGTLLHFQLVDTHAP